MEEGSNSVMMELYRNDRNKLLEFIISSSNLIKEVNSPSGSGSKISDFVDTISVDYVLSCVNSG